MTSLTKSNTVTIWLRSNYGKTILIFDTDMTLQQFNLFRRIILSKIIRMAGDIAQKIENDTSMVDEVLSNRLGLIPVIISDEESFLRKDLCKCSSLCDKCSFVIKYESKRTAEKSWLLSSDISPLFIENIPIVTIYPKQKVSFKLFCSKSNSEEHLKWSPGVVCTLAELPHNKSRNDFLRVRLHNTGPLTFSNLLRQTFTLMKSQLNVDIKIH